MSQFYEVDSTKVSLQEYWWGNPSPLVIIGWLAKWLRVRIPSSSDDPNTDSTLPFVVPALPAQIEPMFAVRTQQLAQLGFLEPVFHVIYDAASSTTWYWATFRHTSGLHFARIHHRVWGRSLKVKPVLFPIFMTRFTDGTFLVSSAGKPDLDTPDTVQMIRKQGSKVEPLWGIHEQKAQELAARKMIKPVSSPEDLIAACEELHVLQRDFHLARGVFRPRSEAEAATAQAQAARVEQARASGVENPEVLVELEKLQDKKTSAQMALWIFLGSLVAFAVMRARNWDWKFMLWLIPVLLFHEAGHWATMRVFKYRNLRMFFIPMFGAAVIGRNWNVPGWKKALVSLAGPMPGIIVGLVLGILSIIYHNQWMNRAALLLLLLNGMNLLPIFPLDGGHVLQDTIFCRNRWLEVVFRCLAIGGLMLFGVTGKAFFYVAIALAVSLPITFRLAKVKEDLGKLNLPQPGPDEDRIPLPTAQAIIKAVKETFGSKLPLSNKTIAQHSLSVFESLNAKPPGVLATLGLLAIQGGGLFIAVIMGLLLTVTGQVGLKDFAQAAARQPRHSVTCAAVQQSGKGPVRPGHLIVTTFNKADEAATAFHELTGQAPADGGLTLFGQSILLAIPAGDEWLREKWFNTMQERSTNLFVQVSNAPVTLSMTFLAKTKADASNLVDEVQEYLRVAGPMRLIAPWSPESHDPNYARYRKARAEWQSIGRELASIHKDPAFAAFGAKIRAAMKRGAMDEVKTLGEEQDKKAKELRAQMLEMLENKPDTQTVELAKLYGKIEELSYTNRVERQTVYRQVAAKLGEVRYVEEKPDPKAISYLASSGTISMHGLLCELRWANFSDPQGLVTFTKWLCDKGCVQMKYDLQGGWGNFADMDDSDSESE